MEGDDPDPRARAATLAARMRSFTLDRAEERRVAGAGLLERGDRLVPIPAEVTRYEPLFPGDRVHAWFADDSDEVLRVKVLERAAVDVASASTAGLVERLLLADLHAPSPAEGASRERLLAALVARPDALAALEAALPGPRAENPPAERRRLELRLSKAAELLSRVAPESRLAFALRQLERGEPGLEGAMVEIVARDPGARRHLLTRPEREYALLRGLAAIPADAPLGELEPLVIQLCEHPLAGVRYEAIRALGRAASSPTPLLDVIARADPQDREWAIDALRRFPAAHLEALRRVVEQRQDLRNPRLAGQIYPALARLLGGEPPDLERAFARGEGETIWDGPSELLTWMRHLRDTPAPPAAPARLTARRSITPALEEIRVEGDGELGLHPQYERFHARSFDFDAGGRAGLRRAGIQELRVGDRSLWIFSSGGYPDGAPPRETRGRLLDTEAPLAPLLPALGARTCLCAGTYLVATIELPVTRVDADERAPWARNLEPDDDGEQKGEPLGVPCAFGPPFDDDDDEPARLAFLPAHTDPALARGAGEVVAYALDRADRDGDLPERRIYAVVLEGARTLADAARAGARVRARLVIPLACAYSRAVWTALVPRLGRTPA